MLKKLLIDLLHDLEQEMLRLGYTEITLKNYRWKWQMLLRFAEERGEKFYSERLGLDFLEKYFNILKENTNCKYSQKEIQWLGVIRMIGDFQLHHLILRQHNIKHKTILTTPYFTAIINQFESYCMGQNYNQITIDRYVNLSSRFIEYLIAQNITTCEEINLVLIHAYIKTLLGYSYRTVGQHSTSIRTFFRFLFETKKIQTEFASRISMAQARKQISIPSVWTEDELKKLIGAIDRRSPIGKRDYAIILLACCLGLRCTDIKQLKAENFHWEEKTLVFIQSKTKVPLSLPLTSEVGWAVIDYLKYGRPKIDSPYIFVKHIAPFVPFATSNSFYTLIKKHMKFAHIPLGKKKRGMHSLRHTMASMLLEKNTPLCVISNMLGHIDTNSTAIYLKVDIEKLRECSLTFGEGSDDE